MGQARKAVAVTVTEKFRPPRLGSATVALELKAEGVPPEDAREAFVGEEARRSPEAFAGAMDVLRRTCERIEAEA